VLWVTVKRLDGGRGVSLASHCGGLCCGLGATGYGEEAGWLDSWIAGKDVGCFAVWPSSYLAVQKGVKKKKMSYAARCAILPFAERMILQLS